MHTYLDRNLIPAAWIAVSGAATWTAMESGDVTGLDDLWALRIVTLAAGLAGLAVAPVFRAGPVGASIGAVLATLLGAAKAGVVLALYEVGLEGVLLGLLFGPVAVFGAIVQMPYVLGAWVVTMTMAAVAAQLPKDGAIRAGSSGCP